MSATTAKAVGGMKTKLMCDKFIPVVNNATKREVALN